MTDEAARLDGMIPEALAPRTRKIMLEDYCLAVDIGFHAFEIGQPQRLLITVEVWLDEASFPTGDDAADAWDYDVMRSAIRALATGRRYNLQETLARAIYDLIAARRGVTALRVATRKPDVYPDCAGVGVELASF
jgi:dihydroneopterin aldolase